MFCLCFFLCVENAGSGSVWNCFGGVCRAGADVRSALFSEQPERCSRPRRRRCLLLHVRQNKTKQNKKTSSSSSLFLFCFVLFFFFFFFKHCFSPLQSRVCVVSASVSSDICGVSSLVQSCCCCCWLFSFLCTFFSFPSFFFLLLFHLLSLFLLFLLFFSFFFTSSFFLLLTLLLSSPPPPSRFFFCVQVVMASDWLQGPYVYALYKDYGFSKLAIGQLFVAGFSSSMIFGTFVGSLADKMGRRRLALFFCIVINPNKYCV